MTPAEAPLGSEGTKEQWHAGSVRLCSFRGGLLDGALEGLPVWEWVVVSWCKYIRKPPRRAVCEKTWLASVSRGDALA